MNNLDYLDTKSKSTSNKNLERLSNFFNVEELNRLSMRSVSIVGTNGKTSTAIGLFRLLCKLGITTCLFTSPHLINSNERISNNDGKISEEDMNRYLNEIIEYENINNLVLGYFETIFLIASKVFIDTNADFFIVEAGIGGRLDTTSIISSEIVALTNIGYEHTDILGESLQEILLEKIRVSNRIKDLLIGEVSTHVNYKSLIDKEMKMNNSNYHFRYSDNRNTSIKRLDGHFEMMNAFLAIDLMFILFDKFPLVFKTKYKNETPLSVEKAWVITKEGIPGRFEVIDHELRKIIDGAHNLSGINVFLDSLELKFEEGEIFNNRYRIPYFDCYLGIKNGKNIKLMIDALVSREWVGIKLISDNTFFDQMKTKQIKDYLNKIDIEVDYGSLEDFHLSKKPSILLGSLYLVGEYKKEFQ